MADEQKTRGEIIAAALQTTAQALAEAVKALKDAAAPVLSNIEKHRLANMGSGNLPFTDKAVELAGKYPELLPKFIELEEFESDIELVHASWSLITQTRELGDLLNDTRIQYGAEGFEKARAFYKAAQAAEKLGVPGASEVVKELAARFKVPGRPAGKNTGDGTQTEEPAES
jgi:hypothetical protein